MPYLLVHEMKQRFHFSTENKSSFVFWCWKQKRGIKIEEPNDNLCKAYIQKAKSALNMLDSAIEKDEID